MGMPPRILLVLTATALSVSACTAATATSTPTPVSTVGREAALWELAPGFTPSPQSTSLTVSVSWLRCASGVAVEDPQPVVTYSVTEVSLSIWGKSPGDGNPSTGETSQCNGNVITSFQVPLTEPLGDRAIIEGAVPSGRFTATSSAGQSSEELVDELTSRRELYGMRVNGAHVAPDGRVVLLVQSTNREGLDGLRSRYGDRVIVQEADAGNDAGTQR